MQADKYGSDFPVVYIFKKHRDTYTEGDVYIKQWGTEWVCLRISALWKMVKITLTD